MADLRNDLARARDAWLNSDEGAQCTDGIASGLYLHNRIQAAFVAGWTARENHRARAKERKR